ncbi:histidine kinase [Massilia sp. W12]|uniref:sensor histidine kinase n=1 Tax=Massilia sp. W12 TaxID=3126507 RepID=UPI0030CCAEFB
MKRETAQTAAKAREAERLRIAQDLHDAFGGNLTAAALLLVKISHEIPAATPEQAHTLLQLRELISDSKHQLQQVIFDLRPPELSQGLESALKNLCEKWQAYTGIVCHLEFSTEQSLSNQETSPALQMHPEQALALYRIVQEGLHNIAQHAKAAHASVELRLADNSIALKITDNGATAVKPCSSKPGTKGQGLHGMQERINAWGGELHWEVLQQDGRDSGKALCLSMPLQPA